MRISKTNAAKLGWILTNAFKKCDNLYSQDLIIKVRASIMDAFDHECILQSIRGTPFRESYQAFITSAWFDDTGPIDWGHTREELKGAYANEHSRNTRKFRAKKQVQERIQT